MNTYNHSTQNNPSIQTKHHFGYMSGLQQQLGSYDYGQYLIVDTLNHSGQSFELNNEDYAQLVALYRQINIDANQCLFIDVETDQQNQLINWTMIQLPYSLEYASQLMQVSYQRQNLLALFAFIQQLDSKALQSFMWSLFSQPQLAIQFIVNSASHQHHHAYPGGLLDHSMECMNIVKAGLNTIDHLSKREKDITQVAALLHDIGKTQTLSSSGDLKLEGYNINHEHYTLSVMADELKQLKKVYKQAAVALEYILTWKQQDGYPKFIGANLIKAADRISTGAQLREQAFSQLPDYYHFTQIQAGQRAVYLSRIN